MATDTMRRTQAGAPQGQAPRSLGPPEPVGHEDPPAKDRTQGPNVPRTRRSPPRATPGRSPARCPGQSRPTGGRPRVRSPRMPFILLLVGLLGGALVCLLVISTTLAQGAFRITNLQEQNANLARQEQTLTNEVAQAGSPAVIAAEAKQLGMRPNPHLGFIDLKTGKIVTGKPSSAEAAINVPGYTP